MAAKQSGEHFKAELREGKPKYGIFVNSGSSAIAGQLSHLGYDWLLIDFQVRRTSYFAHDHHDSTEPWTTMFCLQ
jgi:2-keto-3-deoxy-L-rhamnonate aldolase RhmA